MWLLDYFSNWTHDDFKRLSVHVQKKIKDMLMDRGIFVDYVGRKKMIAKALDDLVQMTRMPEWPHEIAAAKTFDSRSKMAKGQFPQLTTKNGSEEEEPEVIVSSIESGKKDNAKVPRDDKPNGPQDRLSLPGPAYTYPYRPKLEDDWHRQTPRYTIAPPAPGISMPLGEWDDWTMLPPREVECEPIDSKSMLTFVKIWDKKFAYSGDRYDILDDKVRAFLRACKLSSILISQCWEVFPEMLSGRAGAYYMHHVKPGALFAQAYNAIKVYFDTPNNQTDYYQEWTTVTLAGERQSNPGKLLVEVRALGLAYAGDEHLIAAITRACQSTPEMGEALSEPTSSFQIIISKLRARDAQIATTILDRVKNTNARTVTTLNNSGRAIEGALFVIKRTAVHGSILKKNAAKHEEDEDSTEEEVKQDVATAYFMVNQLQDRAFIHRITGCNNGIEPPGLHLDFEVKSSGQSEGENNYLAPASQFLLDRHKNETFYGIMPDTGASTVSTVGKGQLAAFLRLYPHTKVDRSRVGEYSVRFGMGDPITSTAVITVESQFGDIEFNAMDSPTPFLFCLKDMDRLRVKFDNFTNEMIQGDLIVPVIRKRGHPWFFLDEKYAPEAFLTEVEMRRLHRRFGHPAVDRLHKVLKRAGHLDVDYKMLAQIEEFCHHCQINRQAPRRYRFTLHDDCEYNYEIVVDVMYLDGKPVLHIVDWATSFQAARFLKSLSTKDTWEALRAAWIDTYLGPPDVISHDAGTNFAAVEFRTEARMMGIRCHQVPVEAHNAIGKVERYHTPLRRAYNIILSELGASVDKEIILQMAVKAVNDTVGPDGLVLTVLVFGAYPRMTYNSPPSALTAKRVQAMRKAMIDLRNAMATRKVNNALKARNGPIVTETLNLAPGTDVQVWREGKGWTGPHKVISVNDYNVIVDLPSGITDFRATSVRRYQRDEIESPPTRRLLDTDLPPQKEEEGREIDGLLAGRQSGPVVARGSSSCDAAAEVESGEHAGAVNPNRRLRKRGIHVPDAPVMPPAPRRRGRPPGSKNKPKTYTTEVEVFLSRKEKDDLGLAVKLRREGKITANGAPFELSAMAEIDGLIANGTFKIIHREDLDLRAVRIFNSRLVNEIKGKNEEPYEKSRLVIQGYNDAGKTGILTQAPTIQRASQRLIVSLIATLILMGMVVDLRDITQAYTQSKSKLQRLIVANLPAEMRDKYPPDSLLLVEGALYGIPEAGVHWFDIYQSHHKDRLGMETSTYDPCLLMTTEGKENFGLIGMQTDDTLLVSTESFAREEQAALQEAGFKAKPKTRLSQQVPLEFNGARITLQDGKVYLRQKGQAAKIKPVGKKDRAQKYMEQRARGAYLASICQPEAAYDLAVAAQLQEKDRSEADYDVLNKRLIWQAENPDRGLCFVPINLTKAKIMVFTDGSFANNRDLTSQIGFLIAMVNEDFSQSGQFTITGNILHWASSKCKRVTRSVLASEIYGLTTGFDQGFTLASTVNMITKRLGQPEMPVVICTDSYSLYECLTKLGTTKEKRLMIDLMALRQSYERREIDEIRWIHGDDNPADAFTKSNPNKALQDLVEYNKVTIRVEGFVERTRTN
ncbi:conserved hypothetical protein [Talaromyces stipitatus ATCC 10500]|uniref:Integrase catalytic domain-containing protein n=1 Tax=Talaromyces stipitatus (strain ATCC 10500 / CBS 375.48 / QM 6759 / NRRL 1006) TaxID=441959 RepID=B8MFV9_TALSN|nr:uncharacterized protein TSTA_009480 [Talaromyces stipitatus ATCC 10500]EED15826.1 conserved hypothetical protein [Talaromyces stipitatus ATCC 10500]